MRDSATYSLVLKTYEEVSELHNKFNQADSDFIIQGLISQGAYDIAKQYIDFLKARKPEVKIESIPKINTPEKKKNEPERP